MSHTYYSDDTEQRKRYFDKKFLSNLKAFARNQGISEEKLFSQIRDFESFKKILGIVWSGDASLLSYFEGMNENELRDFFNRESIQNLIKEEIPARIPDEVIQVKKKAREMFKAQIREKKTGRLRRVLARKTFVIVKTKRQVRYRDVLGRFSKIL